MNIITRKSVLPWLALSVVIGLGACSTRLQITEYLTHHEAELTTLNNYCWADNSAQPGALEKVEPTSGHHRDFDQGIREAINKDLASKGYHLGECSAAGFVIDYRMGLHEDLAAVDATSANTGANTYGPRWRIGDDNSVNYEGLQEPREDIITVRHGTIHIAAFTPGNKILWHSSAEKTLREQDDDATRKAGIKKAVHRLMDDFPKHN